MKHPINMTIILISMFLLTQIIGLLVINTYTNQKLPYGFQPPKMKPEVSFTSIIISMAFAIFLILLLTRIKAVIFLKLWFFVVVIIALSLTFNAFLLKIPYATIISLIIALPLAFYKIFKQNLLIHNLTELLIYPGIAAVFVPLLNIWAGIILLILISVYDIYAVWHAGFMQKMAKFQIQHLKIFAGFFIPYLNKKQLAKLKKLKTKKKIKKSKIKVGLALLGGGDVVFPIILAGIVLRSWGFLPAFIITLGATSGLLYLFIAAKKGKFYPAMPFISAGCFIALFLAYLLF